MSRYSSLVAEQQESNLRCRLLPKPSLVGRLTSSTWSYAPITHLGSGLSCPWAMLSLERRNGVTWELRLADEVKKNTNALNLLLDAGNSVHLLEIAIVVIFIVLLELLTIFLCLLQVIIE